MLTPTALGMIMAVFSLVMLLTEDRGTANFDKLMSVLFKMFSLQYILPW